MAALKGIEQCWLLAGYHLLTRMFGRVTYISRAEYADRQAMFDKHVERVICAAGTASKVLLVSPPLINTTGLFAGNIVCVGARGSGFPLQRTQPIRLEVCLSLTHVEYASVVLVMTQMLWREYVLVQEGICHFAQACGDPQQMSQFVSMAGQIRPSSSGNCLKVMMASSEIGKRGCVMADLARCC